MSNLELLKSLRNEVPELELEQLSDARLTLDSAIAREQERSRATSKGKDGFELFIRNLSAKIAVPHAAKWTAAVAALTVFGIVTAALVTQPTPAQAALKQASENAISYTDMTPPAGSYLKMTIHEPDAVAFDSKTGEYTSGLVPRTIKFLPGDPEASSVLQILHIDSDGVVGNTYESELLDTKSQQIVERVPTESGEKALEFFDSMYTGGSASRDEDNYVRITDLLRQGVPQPDTRGALLAALALIPGVSTSGTTQNALGQTGMSFSRAEANRAGERVEVLIDPDTGLFIGERYLDSTGKVLSLTAATYELVDSAPSLH